MSFDPDLGPLGPLVGVWEGEKGTDLAPSDKAGADRQLATSKYRERMVFEPTGRVDNHEQQLFGLRYSTRAWRIGFMPPRGLTVLAGGRAEAGARKFRLEVEAGSEVFGICSSPFLSEEFKTVRYTLDLERLDDDTLYYDEHSWLKRKGRDELFDHRDDNTLRRVSS